jgi:transposase
MTSGVADWLPDDLDALRALVIAMSAERQVEQAELQRIKGELDAERAERQRVSEQNDHLRHLIRQLQRMQFGKRSETLDPDQLNLALEDLEQAVAETAAEEVPA